MSYRSIRFNRQKLDQSRSEKTQKSIGTFLHLKTQSQLESDRVSERFMTDTNLSSSNRRIPYQLFQRKSYEQSFDHYSNNYIAIQRSEKITMHGRQHQSMENLFYDSEVSNDPLNLQDLQLDNRIEISRYRFQYYKLRINHKKSPLQIFVKGKDNLRIFCSTSVQHPSKFNFEFILHSKFFKYHNKQNLQYFSEDFLYFSIYSEEDCSFQLTFQFGENIIKRIITQQQIQPLLTLEEQQQEEEMKLFKYQEMLKKKINHKLIKNKDVSQFTQEAKSKRLIQIKSELNEKIETANEKKKALQIEKQIDVETKYEANKIVYTLRLQQRLEQVRMNQIQQAQQQWLVILQMARLGQILFEKLTENQHKKFIVKQFNQLKVYKIDNHKIFTQSRIVFVQFCKFQNSKSRAQSLISNYIQKNKLSLTLIKSHRRLTKVINALKSQYKNKQQQIKEYKNEIYVTIIQHMPNLLLQLNKPVNKKYLNIPVDKNCLIKIAVDIFKRKQAFFVQKIQEICINKSKNNAFSTVYVVDLPTLLAIVSKYALQKNLIMK